MNAFKEKEFDYSNGAKIAHKKFLRELNRMEDLGKVVSIEEVKRRVQLRTKQQAARLVMDTFRESDAEKRKERWEEFKLYVRSNNLEVSFTQIVKMRRMYLRKNK